MSTNMPIPRVRHRIAQGFKSILPSRLTLGEYGDLARWLTASQFSAFLNMDPFDQAHAYRVFAWLRNKGIDDRELLMAGLFHDVGKSFPGAGIQTTDRALKVILQAGAPEMLESVARRLSSCGRDGLATAVRHPQIGAEMAHELGCSPDTCWLIYHHEHRFRVISKRLSLLQAADLAS